MNANILEIFRSIQGEGKYAGLRQVFVRFFECNMHCRWCDTPASIGDTSRNFKTLSLEQVKSEVDKLWQECHSVSLTGGEPLLQWQFLKEILVWSSQTKKISYLETNGVCVDELSKVIDQVDIVAMDIKMPSSTSCKPYWKEHKDFLEIARRKEVFIKTVVTSDTDPADLEEAVKLVYEADPQLLFILQPNSFELQNGVMNRCNQFYDLSTKYLKNVRVLPQMHRLMKIR